MIRLVIVFWLVLGSIWGHTPPNNKPTLTNPDVYKSVVIEHIKDYEDFSATAYWDIDRYSIGYGTISYRGEVVTEEEAYRRLVEEYEGFLGEVKECYPRLNHSNKLVVAAIMYNIGTPGPGLHNALINNDIEKSRRYIVKYIHAGGKPLQGLKKRRLKEIKMLTN